MFIIDYNLIRRLLTLLQFDVLTQIFSNYDNLIYNSDGEQNNTRISTKIFRRELIANNSLSLLSSSLSFIIAS